MCTHIICFNYTDCFVEITLLAVRLSYKSLYDLAAITIAGLLLGCYHWAVLNS